MKLINFSITNYRSITKKSEISIHEFTVLTGKNNEGKSNILRALKVAMNALMKHNQKISYNRQLGDYNWIKDFPIKFQNRKSNFSVFRLEFILNDSEKSEFYKEI
ncbi:MAG: AAA family ATPase, partial [Ruminococcus sp.]|nr:AAA family ATPase [Ruminococcus sp.]